jgi:hypothetical protein
MFSLRFLIKSLVFCCNPRWVFVYVVILQSNSIVFGFCILVILCYSRMLLQNLLVQMIFNQAFHHWIIPTMDGAVQCLLQKGGAWGARSKGGCVKSLVKHSERFGERRNWRRNWWLMRRGSFTTSKEYVISYVYYFISCFLIDHWWVGFQFTWCWWDELRLVMVMVSRFMTLQANLYTEWWSGICMCMV